MSSVHVKGLSELQKLLDTLPAKLEANVMRGALRAGANVVKNEAKQNINNVSGELAKGLKVSARIDKRTGSVAASVRASGPHDYIAKFVEYGTQPHLISVEDSQKPVNKRLSRKRGKTVLASMTTINRAMRIGAEFVGPQVFHPGARARPFMRPALDNQASNAVIAAGNYIKKRLSTKHGLDTSDIVIGEDE